MSSAHNLFDVIVLGVGSMGSAACYHLAKRGSKVLGLDQFEIPHNQGSHHGKSRMIRKAYYENPDYVPLLHRAYELWDELQIKAKEPVINRTGAVYFGRPEDSIVSGSLESAKQHHLPHRLHHQHTHTSYTTRVTRAAQHTPHHVQPPQHTQHKHTTRATRHNTTTTS